MPTRGKDFHKRKDEAAASLGRSLAKGNRVRQMVVAAETDDGAFKQQSDNVLAVNNVESVEILTAEQPGEHPPLSGIVVGRHDARANRTSKYQSVTEECAMDKLLVSADIAQKRFVAEKLAPQFLASAVKQLSSVIQSVEPVTQSSFRPNAVDLTRLVCIPRRPSWPVSSARISAMSIEELAEAELTAFHEWLDELTSLAFSLDAILYAISFVNRFQLGSEVLLTPFERNIELWRQLWHVFERSHVVVQIVDARNPLLFYCVDLVHCVHDVDARKAVILLINKADLLSDAQRRLWFDYYQSIGIDVAFYSAWQTNNELKSTAQYTQKGFGETSTDGDDDSDDKGCDSDNECPQSGSIVVERSKFDVLASLEEGSTDDDRKIRESQKNSISFDRVTHKKSSLVSAAKFASISEDKVSINPWDVLSRCQLILRLEKAAKATDYARNEVELSHSAGKLVIGLCGFPNVGKSSTLNSLIGRKKVAVSATPGRTKHFQTINLSNELVLCDSPGLIMPTVAHSRAELIVNAILPLGQLKGAESWQRPVELIYGNIARDQLERAYGVALPADFDSNDFLASVAFQRGFMGSLGRPDTCRAARGIIRDYTMGRLLYCTPPPGVDEDHFRRLGTGQLGISPESSKPIGLAQLGNARFTKQTGITKGLVEYRLDTDFFLDNVASGVVVMEPRKTASSQQSGSLYDSCNAAAEACRAKPWKKHHNQKKVKLRNMFAHLDS